MEKPQKSASASQNCGTVALWSHILDWNEYREVSHSFIKQQRTAAATRHATLITAGDSENSSCLTQTQFQPQLLVRERASHKDIGRVGFFLCLFAFVLFVCFLQASGRMVALSLWASYGHILSPIPVAPSGCFALILPAMEQNYFLWFHSFYICITFICMCMTQHTCGGDQKTTLRSLFSPFTVWEVRY